MTLQIFKPHAYLFVDGSSGPKEDVGGYAAVAVCAAGRKLLYGTMYPTTISRCELMPIIEGLRWIKRNWARGVGYRVAVCSDSEYTVKTLCGVNQRRKNDELWKAADEAAQGMVVRYTWRERNSLDYMEMCDGICGTARQIILNEMGKLFPDIRQPEGVLPVGDKLEQLELLFGVTNGKENTGVETLLCPSASPL